MTTTEVQLGVQSRAGKERRFWQIAWRQRYLYMMSLPFVAWVIVFCYFPIWGWSMAFENFQPGKSIFHQQWVGLANFVQLFQDSMFYTALRNTLAMSIMGLIAGYTIPIIFALVLNEVRMQWFKRTVQTVSYLPHFVSWVVVASIVSTMLSIDSGTVNGVLMALHIIHKPVLWLSKPHWFWWIVTAADVWKETGWNAIIFLAAISGIDPELYEAATVDGAGRFRRMWHITLPGIRRITMVMLILSIGNLINIGFEKQFLLGNPMVQDYSQVLDLYSLNYGLNMYRFSYGTAISMFNSVVSVILLIVANSVFKKVTRESVI